MGIDNCHRYQITLRNREISSITFDGKNINHFLEPDSLNKTPKLYIIKSGPDVIYIGQTTQSIRTRIRQGLTAKGTHGYWGYKWKELSRIEILVWCFPDESQEYIEAIEGELVFLYRKHKGQWPKYQMEIHFHNRIGNSYKVAQLIFEQFISQTSIVVKPWGNPGKAKILVIGHDPEGQNV